MKKANIWKRALALAASAALLLGCAGCGSSGSGTESGGSGDGTDAYLIGYNTWGAGVAVFEQMMIEIPFSIETLGGEASGASDDFTADTELNNIKNFVSAGVDGVLMQCAASTTLSEAISVCESAGIPLAMGIFPSTPEDRAAIESDIYVGCGYADLVTDGYNAGAEAAEAGYKTAVIIGGNLGDPNNDDRVEGFTDAFESAGGQVVDTARCTSPAEALEKANALLSANRDVDMIYCITSDYAPGTITALESLSLEIPVYASSLSAEVLDYVRNGQIVRTSYGNDLGQGFAVALLFNYLDGHQILDDEGNVPDLGMVPFRVDAENVEAVVDLFFTDGVHPFSQKMLETLAWRYNESVTYQDFVDMMDSIENDAVAYLASMQ
ncbi:MAG: sugar ABC transporter substrate-binding protein [Oscillospiraceae bacterium]|nr:sugar ABC transporter substrate-binding protein [Oscillospiraceae bacterium]